MPVEVVSYMLSDSDAGKRLQFQLILQCAPFFKGIKIACITNVEEGDMGELQKTLMGTGISYRVLAMCKGRCLVFLYRRKELKRYLEREEIREFLAAYGYQALGVEGMLNRLSHRVCQYSSNEICFPHEIGAFLDYPIDDVKCFIEKRGKDYLAAGYWKVYHDLKKAQMTFLAYDKARTSAVNEFLVGKAIRDIVQGQW